VRNGASRSQLAERDSYRVARSADHLREHIMRHMERRLLGLVHRQ